jgi:hypothetical protein
MITRKIEVMDCEACYLTKVAVAKVDSFDYRYNDVENGVQSDTSGQVRSLLEFMP